MKFYLLTLLLILFQIQFSLGQDKTIENKSELPKMKTESLQVSAEIDLYPNPVTDFLNVSIKDSRLKDVKFEMYNIIGNKLDLETAQVSANNYKINVGNYNPGYYLLIIKDPVSRFNKAFKFRKQ